MSEIPDNYGAVFEEHARLIAAGAGVPDFVFRPVDIRKGKAQREVGDGLLWIGPQVVVVSMKARDPTAVDGDDRAVRWLEKNIRKATAQIQGTARTLRNPPPGLIVKSERGVSVPWERSMVTEVTGAVVVAHPAAQYYTSPKLADVIPTIVLDAQTWRFIHERLWSAAAVVKYLSWRARCGVVVPIGAERDVFAAAMIEEADRTDPKKPSLVKITPGLWERLVLERPNDLFGMNDEDRYAGVIDVLIAAAAESDPVFSNVKSASDYLEITRFLDRIPPFHRVVIAKDILAKCDDVGSNGGRRSMLAATPSGLLVFTADSAERSIRAAHLQGLTLARHSQTLDAVGNPELATLGIATEGSGGGGRSHDFVFIRGRIDLSAAEARQRDDAFGTPSTIGS